MKPDSRIFVTGHRGMVGSALVRKLGAMGLVNILTQSRDPSKAKAKPGWTPKITLPELVREMVESDYAAARRDSMVKAAGFQACHYNE